MRKVFSFKSNYLEIENLFQKSSIFILQFSSESSVLDLSSLIPESAEYANYD